MIPKRISRAIRKTLQLSITLLSLIVLLYYMYSQWSPGYVDHQLETPLGHIFARNVLGSKHAQTNSGLKLFPDNERNENNKEQATSIVRKTLTKSSYPLTLTAAYIIRNSDVCSGVDVEVLFMVHTAPAYIKRRQGIRETFGNKYIFKYINIRIVFLLGIPSDNQTQQSIQEENWKYLDIVQGDFLDSYRNLTLKGVMGFRWITEHCSHAKLVVKMDDDFFIDIFKVVQVYVPRYANKTKQLVCNPMYPSPILREKGNKWQVSGDYFRGVKYYPRYCSGFTVFMTPDTVKSMYYAAFFTPFFWVDDVYLFGLLPSKQYINQIEFENFSLKLDICKKSYSSPEPTKFVSCGVKKEKLRKMMWEQTLRKLPKSMRQKVNREILATNGMILTQNDTMQNS